MSPAAHVVAVELPAGGAEEDEAEVAFAALLVFAVALEDVEEVLGYDPDSPTSALIYGW